MAFHFPLMPRIFMAVRRESRFNLLALLFLGLLVISVLLNIFLFLHIQRVLP